MIRKDKTSEWLNKLAEIKDILSSRFLPLMDFRERVQELLEISDCPFERVEITCTYENRTIFKLATGDISARNINPQNYDDQIGPNQSVVSLTAKYWGQPGAVIRAPEFKKYFVELVEAYLAIPNRGDGMMIVNAQPPEALNRVKETLNGLYEDFPDRELSVAYLDLDYFKALNDKLGHDVGDLALRDFEKAILDVSETARLLGFRKGGDEYSLIFSGMDDFSMLSTLDKLHRQVQSKSYGEEGLHLDLTVGIAKYAAGSILSFEALLKSAEHATTTAIGNKGVASGKKRGTVSFVNTTPVAITTIDGTTFTKLGVAILRSGILHPKPFSNVALNVISAHVFNYAFASLEVDTETKLALDDEVTQLSQWLGLTSCPTFAAQHLIGDSHFNAVVPHTGLALAVAHGLLRAYNKIDCSKVAAENLATFAISISVSSHDEAVVSGLKDIGKNKLIWGSPSAQNEWLSIGGLITTDYNHDTTEFQPIGVALAVGLNQKLEAPGGCPLPTGLFAGMVVVDDRPKSGGGLPDFWQAALANLCALRLQYACSVKRIFVLGNPTAAPETFERLKGEKKVDIHELALLTNSLPETVNDFLSWALQNLVFVPHESFVDLVSALYECSLEFDILPKQQGEKPRLPIARISRILSADKLLLPLNEGLCCETPLEAYPAVLDLLRHSDSAILTLDDANQKMFELVGFKLLVDKPGGDAIPDYWHGEHDSMDSYAQAVLIGRDSLIGRHFYGDGQFDKFIEHLTEYFANNEGKASTRRAILIVPNQFDSSDENNPKPLGLTSVWATPRHINGQPQLSFCFVWRTVEALVGFPYSLYGSVKLAHHIASEINTKLQEHPGKISRVSVGPLRYLALSLHMRVDDYHRRFAKRVVDAASD